MIYLDDIAEPKELIRIVREDMFQQGDWESIV
jgi:hypothetical protein